MLSKCHKIVSGRAETRNLVSNKMEVPQRSKNRIAIWSRNSAFGHVLEKTIIQKDTCSPIFIAALFTPAKTWKQSKCPSTDTWIKMLYIYSVEYYSARKNNEIMPFAATGMDLEFIPLSEVRQRQISYDTTYIWNLKNKMIQLNLFTKQKQTHRHRKET